MKKAKYIQYELIYPNGHQNSYSIEINPQSLEHAPPVDPPPDWCRLEVHQCDICPLQSNTTPFCPLATRIAPLLAFEGREHHEAVTAKVTRDSTTIISETTTQDAYRSLIGLLIATSGCPHTRFFKPMAWFHLPFSTQEETFFRACATFLLFQFFNDDDSEDGGYFSDLKAVYENIHRVNLGIAERLRETQSSDSALNAIVVLDVFATSFIPVLNESLTELAFLFDSNKR